MSILKFTLYLLPLLLTSVVQDATGENISSSYPESFHTRQSSSGNALKRTSYTYNILPLQKELMRYSVTGFIPSTALKFNIELCPESDCFPVVAFQFSVRLNTHLVVRTHKTDGKWATEDRSGSMPFKRNANFNITMELRTTKYEVYVNREYFCEYRYYFQADKVEFIKVYGDIQLKRTSVSYGHRDLQLRRSIVPGDWIRFVFNRNEMNERFVQLVGDNLVALLISGKKGKKFEVSCRKCSKIPFDIIHEDQEKIIVAIEVLSDGLVKIYDDKQFLTSIQLVFKEDIQHANLFMTDDYGDAEFYRNP